MAFWPPLATPMPQFPTGMCAKVSWPDNRDLAASSFIFYSLILW